MMLKRCIALAVAFLYPALVVSQESGALVLSPPVQAIISPEKDAIIGTLDRYIKGFGEYDADSLSRTLHLDAAYAGGLGDARLNVIPFAKLIEQFRTVGRGRNQTKSDRTVTDLFLHGNIASALLLDEPRPPSRAAGTKTYHSIQMYKSSGTWQVIQASIYNDRYKGQADDQILDIMGLTPGMTVGEIGAGNGRYTMPLARRVGDTGKVYANDIDRKALEDLSDLCRKTGIRNVEPLVGKVDDPSFPTGALDVAIMVSVYHHLDQPVALMKNLKPSLKPGAAVIILDPAYDRTGDKDSDRPTTKERVMAEAEEAGYDLITMNTSLPRDNIFILGVKGDKGRWTAGPVPASTDAPAVVTDKEVILETIASWWKGHDTDDAELLEKVLHPDARSWFEHEGKLQFLPYSKDLERIKSGNRRPARDRPEEKRTVVDFAQKDSLSLVTVRVEIPLRQSGVFRGFTTFQLYRADGRWIIVNLAGFNEPMALTK